MKQKEVSEYLGITMDSLRNWEMNGLLTVKRRENGYRVYTDEDIQRLKIIRPHWHLLTFGKNIQILFYCTL